MEENQELNNNKPKDETINNQENVVYRKHVCFEANCWKQCLAMVCAAFFGGFLAFYFVADQYMHKNSDKFMFNDGIEARMLHDMDKMYNRNLEDIKRSFAQNDVPQRFKPDKFDKHFMYSSPVKVSTDVDDDNFNVIVSLKAFNNDENNINYIVKDKKLTVFGNSEIKNKNSEQRVSFSQDFILPENANTKDISKTKDGHKLIISVPLTNQ